MVFFGLGWGFRGGGGGADHSPVDLLDHLDQVLHVLVGVSLSAARDGAEGVVEEDVGLGGEVVDELVLHRSELVPAVGGVGA